MVTVLNNPIYVSDWLKHEADNNHSRDTATLASGSGLIISGTVLAKVTASGKYVPAAASGSDGSQTAVALLVCGDKGGNTTVDATSADQRVVILNAHADVSHAGITYGSTINDATKRAAANAQLAAVGIKVREGA